VSDQLALVGTPTPPDLRLTKRQRFALELIARLPLSSESLGAALHERRRAEGGKGHSATTTCQFCKSEGAHMGATLRKKGLVRFARNLAVWYAEENGRPRPDRGAQTDEIPF